MVLHFQKSRKSYISTSVEKNIFSEEKNYTISSASKCQKLIPQPPFLSLLSNESINQNLEN
uniref:Uncharacterized protein MANES_13G040100 n=1 Tax=Rhizophora mucronata TaxID=61149 RepID=A0A2P2MLS8_RHIMU